MAPWQLFDGLVLAPPRLRAPSPLRAGGREDLGEWDENYRGSRLRNIYLKISALMYSRYAQRYALHLAAVLRFGSQNLRRGRHRRRRAADAKSRSGTDDIRRLARRTWAPRNPHPPPPPPPPRAGARRRRRPPAARRAASRRRGAAPWSEAQDQLQSAPAGPGARRAGAAGAAGGGVHQHQAARLSALEASGAEKGGARRPHRGAQEPRLPAAAAADAVGRARGRARLLPRKPRRDPGDLVFACQPNVVELEVRTLLREAAIAKIVPGSLPS